MQDAAERPPTIRRLSYNALYSVPFDVDWTEAFTQDNEARASIVYPDFSNTDEKALANIAAGHGWGYTDGPMAAFWHDFNPDDPDENGNRCCEVCLEPDPESCAEKTLAECRDALSEWYAENPEDLEPLMSYAYPIPGACHSEDLQAELIEAGVPVCVVELDGSPVLALTGGGMDLSWEICRAYMIAGLFPPVHFAARLSRMAGDEQSTWKADVAAHALASCYAAKVNAVLRLTSAIETAERFGVDVDAVLS